MPRVNFEEDLFASERAARFSELMGWEEAFGYGVLCLIWHKSQSALLETVSGDSILYWSKLKNKKNRAGLLKALCDPHVRLLRRRGKDTYFIVGNTKQTQWIHDQRLKSAKGGEATRQKGLSSQVPDFIGHKVGPTGYPTGQPKEGPQASPLQCNSMQFNTTQKTLQSSSSAMHKNAENPEKTPKNRMIEDDFGGGLRGYFDLDGNGKRTRSSMPIEACQRDYVNPEANGFPMLTRGCDLFGGQVPIIYNTGNPALEAAIQVKPDTPEAPKCELQKIELPKKIAEQVSKTTEPKKSEKPAFFDPEIWVDRNESEPHINPANMNEGQKNYVRNFTAFNLLSDWSKTLSREDSANFMKSWHELKTKREPMDVAHCILFLLKFGTPGKREPVKHPMRYLMRSDSAFSAVLAEVQKRRNAGTAGKKAEEAKRALEIAEQCKADRFEVLRSDFFDEYPDPAAREFLIAKAQTLKPDLFRWLKIPEVILERVVEMWAAGELESDDMAKGVTSENQNS